MICIFTNNQHISNHQIQTYGISIQNKGQHQHSKQRSASSFKTKVSISFQNKGQHQHSKQRSASVEKTKVRISIQNKGKHQHSKQRSASAEKTNINMSLSVCESWTRSKTLHWWQITVWNEEIEMSWVYVK